MTCTLMIPPVGLMELWNYDKPALEALGERDSGLTTGAVRIDLVTDGRAVGRAAFNTGHDLAENLRGSAAIRYLIGAHFTINGPLVIDGLDERAAIEIMQELAG